ncbi:MAG: hypothetical protein V1774_02915 [Candidatus Eisenbacteria bacterium]
MRASLILGLGVLPVAAGAQDADELWRVWEDCRLRLGRLSGERGRIAARSDSLARARAQAREARDAERDRALLAEGESLVDSLRVLSAAALAQELVCEELRGVVTAAIEDELARRLAQPRPEAGAALDSLLARRARLPGAPDHSLLAEFEVPRGREDDPPELLRQRADYARDLADRIGRWLEIVAAEQRRRAQQRLVAERVRLLEEQAIFDEPATVRGDGLAAEPADLTGSAFGELIARMPASLPEGSGPDVILGLLEGWLRTRREALMEQAAEMEGEAQRREQE